MPTATSHDGHDTEPSLRADQRPPERLQPGQDLVCDVPRLDRELSAGCDGQLPGQAIIAPGQLSTGLPDQVTPGSLGHPQYVDGRHVLMTPLQVVPEFDGFTHAIEVRLNLPTR
ncbi:MAG: hypothetical protein ABSH20_09775 [Tepidisphaeraceae bacterium]|jgi:hypothetical protein